MRISIHAHHVAAPRDIAAFVAKHLLTPLERLYDSPATRLTIHVEDATPGRGGIGQACKITFRMPNARTMRVEAVRDDLHAALLDCAQRLRRLVQREVAKQRSPGRAPISRPLGRIWRERAHGAELTPDGTPATL